MQKFKSVEELVNQLKPDKPVYCIRKNSILSASEYFQKKFPGKILFAVKTNPNSEVIKTLIESGIDQFDVASIEEIKAVRKFSQTVKCSYMHTVKSRESISEAYFKYGVKTFALDTKDELIKIIESMNKIIGILFPDKTIAGNIMIKIKELTIKKFLIEKSFFIKNNAKNLVLPAI